MKIINYNSKPDMELIAKAENALCNIQLQKQRKLCIICMTTLVAIMLIATTTSFVIVGYRAQLPKTFFLSVSFMFIGISLMVTSYVITSILHINRKSHIRFAEWFYITMMHQKVISIKPIGHGSNVHLNIEAEDRQGNKNSYFSPAVRYIKSNRFEEDTLDATIGIYYIPSTS